ncbi:MAG: acyltransferase family protein [Flavisolibacter sp.]
MPSSFFSKFRRITYSTSYLPEVDGLRFLAIFSVVVIMHINHYINDRFFNGQLIQDEYLKSIIHEGGNGVTLFFVISGFILSLPFAKWRINGEKKVQLKNYYLRRVTRLEPPYIIALIIFFIANVWVLHKYSFDQLLPHFIASVFYLHTIIYDSFSWVLPVAWSLEVEVQFYILAPIFFLIFLLRSPILRWTFCAAIILVSSIHWFDVWKLPHVFTYLHYFFMGILLADLYCSNFVLIKNHSAGFVAGMIALLGFIFLPSVHYFPGYLIKLACMFILFHTVLTNHAIKKIFSINGIVIIGGMCYSIYLLHLAIVSALGQIFIRSGIDYANKNYFVPYVLVFALAVLIISAVFFILVEKPFMKPWGLGKNYNRKER